MRAKNLTKKLMAQHFDRNLLMTKCSKFFHERPNFKVKFRLIDDIDIERCLFESDELLEGKEKRITRKNKQQHMTRNTDVGRRKR